MPDFTLEDHYAPASPRAAPALVGGIDEVGRGCWAGPVLAVAAVFRCREAAAEVVPRLRDSKKLTLSQREALFEPLQALCHVGVGQASVAEIDEINILQAALLAMERAAVALDAELARQGLGPCAVWLVDGNKLPRLPAAIRAPASAATSSAPAHAIVKGDDRSATIAAAAIIAKVTRDRIMTELSHQYPHFGWDTNAGYGTATHRAALAQHPPTEHHRRSFKPIRTLLDDVA